MQFSFDTKLKSIAEKVEESERLTFDEGVALFKTDDLNALGESRTVELKYLIELLEKSLGKKARIEKLPMQPGDVFATFADITKARNLLGYNPKTEIEEGIRRFSEWVKEVYQPSSVKNF